MRIEQPVQINFSTPGQQAAAQKFAALHTGDIIPVQVLGLDKGKLLIRMQDGSSLRADFKGEMFFLPGDLLDLALESRTSRAVAFRLSSVNGQPLRMEASDSEISLLRSGIEPTRQNLSASRILQQYGYTPTPENLANLSRIMQENPNMPQETAAFFAANNLEPEEEVVRLFTQIQSETSLLGNRATALQAAIHQLFPSAEQGNPSGAQVLSQAPPLQTAADTPAQPADLPKNTPKQPADMPVQQQQAAGAQRQPEAPAARVFMDQVLKSLQQADPQAARQTADSPQFTALIRQLPAMSPGQAQTAVRDFASSLALSPTQQKAVTAALHAAYSPPAAPPPNAPIQPQTPDAGTNSPKASVSPANTPPNPQTLQTLFQHLNNFFATVQPQFNTVTAESLQNTLRRQEKQAEDVETAVAGLVGEKHTLTRQASEIRSQIGLNAGLENFYYCQIPLQFREQKTTAELYVFERNRRTQEAREDCTILIALDTQNMGRCETLLRADGRSLDIRLRLTSQTACRFAEENAQELRGSLEDAGFTLKNLSFEVLEKKTTPLNAQSVFAAISSFAPGGLDIQV